MPGHPSPPAARLLQARYRLAGEQPPGRLPAAVRLEGLRQEARRPCRPPHRLRRCHRRRRSGRASACAVRLGQLLGDDPATMEQLGEVPRSRAREGRAPGAHELSGAIVNPSALRELFPDIPLDQMPDVRPGHRRGRLFLMSKRRAQRLPTPPPFHNKGNWIFSLVAARRAGWRERAEELGAFVLPETDRACAARRQGRACAACRPAPKGLGRDGKEPSGRRARRPRSWRRRRCWPRARRGTCAAWRTTASRLRSALPAGLRARRQGDLAGPASRSTADHAHARLAAARRQAKYGEFGGSFIYPMGADQLCIGFVVGLEYADSGLSPHDVLQEFKTHPFIRRLLEGGERVAWGAKTIPVGRLLLDPRHARAAGRRADGRLGRHGQHADAEGRPLRDALRHARRRGDLRRR